MNDKYKIKKYKKFFYKILIFLLIISDIYIIKYYNDICNAQDQSYLIEKLSIEQKVSNTNTSDINITDSNEPTHAEETKTERMLQIKELKKENSDIIGWVEIENTNMSFPVLQGTDNSFYMNHDYQKKYSFSGSIFLDKDYNWNPPSSNLLLYGHNMKNNTMFQGLLKYKNISFYQEYPKIRFTTEKEDYYYEIISVLETRVFYKSEKDVFRYYNFINAENEAEYNEFINNAKRESLYDTGNTASFGEQLLTLSTCSYHTKNGRFAVIAKRANKIDI